MSCDTALLKSMYKSCAVSLLAQGLLCCQKESRLTWRDLFLTNLCWLLLNSLLTSRQLCIVWYLVL